MRIRRLTQPAPLLPLAIALVVGIVAGGSFVFPLWGVLLMTAVGLVAAFAVSRWPYMQSTLIVVSFFFVGMARIQMSSQPSSDEERVGVVKSWFLERRAVLLDRYREAMPLGHEDQYAVLAAMTLGDKSTLTPELRQTYSISGASHVLALSGLHLGMIFMLISWVTAGRRHHWLSQVVIILSLWAFAFLTGLSNSVVRSATMLSVYALFSISERGRASVNVLAFTAIVLLLVDARALFDIGFQMSYLAVLSILMFMPLFGEMLPAQFMQRHRWLNWLCSILVVSMAAQIGVMPLVAYYFHRFSTWFLPASLVVVPLATAIIYGGLFTLLVPPLAPALFWLVKCLNSILSWIATWPLASIEDLSPSVLQVVMIYVAELCLYLLLARLADSNNRN